MRDWAPFVLLLIDVQRDFWTQHVSKSFPDFPGNVTRLLSLCRTQGLDVVHLRARFKPDMSDWMAPYKLRGHIPCIEATPGVETLPFGLERPGETVMVKQTFDGFQTAELLPYLRREGKRFVLAAGLVTSVCVLFTATSAAQNGFLATVVEDCCADDPILHKQTLETYSFIFDHTTVDLIPERYSDWHKWLSELEQPEALESS